MRIFAKNGSDHSVKLAKWESGDGKMPRQAMKCEKPFEVTLDKAQVKVYHNLSKSGVQYYYTQVGGVWMWTRDDFSAQSDYTVKAPEVKKEAVVTEASQKLEDAAKKHEPSVKVREVKVVKK